MKRPMSNREERDPKNHSTIVLGRSTRPEVIINRNVPLTRAQAKADYTWTGSYRNGKPVFLVPTPKVISKKSAFSHKGLCDGPTFTLGLSCFFSCLFRSEEHTS